MTSWSQKSNIVKVSLLLVFILLAAMIGIECFVGSDWVGEAKLKLIVRNNGTIVPVNSIFYSEHIDSADALGTLSLILDENHTFESWKNVARKPIALDGSKTYQIGLSIGGRKSLIRIFGDKYKIHYMPKTLLLCIISSEKKRMFFLCPVSESKDNRIISIHF